MSGMWSNMKGAWKSLLLIIHKKKLHKLKSNNSSEIHPRIEVTAYHCPSNWGDRQTHIIQRNTNCWNRRLLAKIYLRIITRVWWTDTQCRKEWELKTLQDHRIRGAIILLWVLPEGAPSGFHSKNERKKSSFFWQREGKGKKCEISSEHPVLFNSDWTQEKVFYHSLMDLGE